METLKNQENSVDFKVSLSEKEKNLIDIIRSIKYGKVEVVIQDSVPLRVEKVTESYKL